jgi:hypothetical protein
MSKIEPLPGCHWPPKAALLDILEDIDNIESVFILYETKDGFKNYSAGNMTQGRIMWAIMNHLYRMLRDNNE